MNGNNGKQKVFLGLNGEQLAILAAGVVVLIGLALYFTGVFGKKGFYTDENYDDSATQYGHVSIFPEAGEVTLLPGAPEYGIPPRAILLGEVKSVPTVSDTGEVAAEIEFSGNGGNIRADAVFGSEENVLIVGFADRGYIDPNPDELEYRTIRAVDLHYFFKKGDPIYIGILYEGSVNPEIVAREDCDLSCENNLERMAELYGNNSSLIEAIRNGSEPSGLTVGPVTDILFYDQAEIPPGIGKDVIEI